MRGVVVFVIGWLAARVAGSRECVGGGRRESFLFRVVILCRASYSASGITESEKQDMMFLILLEMV